MCIYVYAYVCKCTYEIFSFLKQWQHSDWLYVHVFAPKILKLYRLKIHDKLFFFFREMTAFFRGLTTIFRRHENSNNFQTNDHFFQNLLMDCSGAIHLILGTFLLPIFWYPLPHPKMDFLIPAARSRSSRGPAKYAQIFSEQAQNFRIHTTIFRT